MVIIVTMMMVVMLLFSNRLIIPSCLLSLLSCVLRVKGKVTLGCSCRSNKHSRKYAPNNASTLSPTSKPFACWRTRLSICTQLVVSCASLRAGPMAASCKELVVDPANRHKHTLLDLNLNLYAQLLMACASLRAGPVAAACLEVVVD